MLQDSLAKQRKAVSDEYKGKRDMQEKCFTAKRDDLERQIQLLKNSVAEVQSSATAIETAQEGTEKKSAELAAELQDLEGKLNPLVVRCEELEKEKFEYLGRCKAQCEIFQGLYQRTFAVAGSLGMRGLWASANYQADDVGSYSLFFAQLVDKLEKAATEMQGMIEAECRDLVELAGERIFTNLHMLDAIFSFERVLKKPEPEKAAKVSCEAVVDHVAALVNLYRRGPADGEETSSSSGDYVDSSAL